MSITSIEGPAMRTWWLLAIVVALSATRLGAAPPGESTPRHKAVVVCFNGKDKSGSSCSTGNFQPDGALHKTGKMTCGYPGKVSQIEWRFLGRREGKDEYRFTRRFPVDGPTTNTMQKVVKFAGDRVKVFEDDAQCIVMEAPGKRGS
jgi:hypothetical protein